MMERVESFSNTLVLSLSYTCTLTHTHTYTLTRTHLHRHTCTDLHGVHNNHSPGGVEVEQPLVSAREHSGVEVVPINCDHLSDAFALLVF
jgi:hypothetical protein